MRLPQDQRFRDERLRFALRFNCEDCVMFDPQQESCAHGYPTAEHRAARYESPEVALVFCKDFDLA